MKVKNTLIKSLKKNFWPLFSILVLVLIFFWRVVLQGKIPLPGDFIVGVYYPWLDYKWGFPAGVPVKNPMTTDVVSLIFPEQMLAIDMLKRGVLPLWNPTILAGTPLLANLQAAPFSPTNFLYFVFDKLTAWSFQIILAHILASVFTYFLLRHWKVSKLGAVVGGIIFSFFGFNLIFSQWNGHTLSSAFISLIILFTSRFLKYGKYLDGVGLSISLAMQIISGYPQVVLYTGFALGLYWLINRHFLDLRRTLLLGAFVLLGFGLVAFQLFPTIELWKLSQRSYEPHPFEWAFLPWQKIITFIAPDFFGNHATANYWGPQDYTSNTGFVGVVAVILSGMSLRSLRFLKKNRIMLFILTLLILSLVLAFPTPLSVFIWKSNLLGMRAASAHRITILTNFSLACLAGFGVGILIKTKRIDIKKLLLLPLGILILYGAWSLYGFFNSREFVRGIDIYQVALRNLIFPFLILTLSAAGLIIAKKYKKLGLFVLFGLMLWELMRFGWKFTPFAPRDFVFPTTPVLSFLSEQEKPVRITGNKVIPNNLRTVYGFESIEGYETIQPLRMAQLLSAINSGKTETDVLRRYGIVDNDTSRLLDLVNTKFYLAMRDDVGRFDKERFDVAFEDKSVAVLESNSVLPRAFMVYDWEVINKDQEILEKLLDPSFQFTKKIILEEDISLSQQVEVGNLVEYLEYEEQKSVIEVETEKPGMLFVSDAHYPGWRAFVDNAETKIYRANYTFRAVEVPSGKHTVRFSYEPESFFNGLKLSVASLIVLYFILKKIYLK